MAEKKTPGVFRRPDGRSDVYYVRFTYQGKPYRWSSGETTRAPAAAYLADIKRSIRDGNFEEKYLHISKAALKLSDGIAWYMANFVELNTVREKNKRDTARILGDFLQLIGDKPITTVARLDIERYKMDRLARGNSKGSINRHLGCISGFFSRMARKDIIQANPLQGKIDYYPENGRRNRYATPEELAQILGSVQNSEFKMIILLALFTGMRLSNITTLRMENINLERGFFQIVQVKRRPGDPPKMNVIPIGRVVFPLLKKYIEKYKITDRLFQFESQTITNLWIAKMKELGIQGLRFHDLRRTIAIYIRNNTDADMFLIQKILGHSQPSMTDAVYAMTEVEKKRKAIDQGFDGIKFLENIEI